MKKVAIIGAGIFGLSAAIRLSKAFEVHVFERHETTLKEASTNNQLRYHMGYHYPRSEETVQQIRDAQEEFESEYKDALRPAFPAYYPVAKEGSLSTVKEFLNFCTRNNLPIEEAYPNEQILDRSTVAYCGVTPETVYRIDTLRSILDEKLSKTNVQVHFNTEITGGRKQGDKKILVANAKELEFDIVVNITYSQYNLFNDWFGFPKKEIRYDLMELLEIEIPIKEQYAITVMDGPFCTMLPYGKNTWSLGHVLHSKRDSKVAFDLPKEIDVQNKKLQSNRDKIIEESSKFFPIVKQAKVVRSLFVNRAVLPRREHDDARPSELVRNGHLSYSIFGGKVITSVQMANRLYNMIQDDLKKSVD